LFRVSFIAEFEDQALGTSASTTGKTPVWPLSVATQEPVEESVIPHCCRFCLSRDGGAYKSSMKPGGFLEISRWCKPPDEKSIIKSSPNGAMQGRASNLFGMAPRKFIWGAHAPRVLAMAPSPSRIFSPFEHCGEAPQ
jgi:hypothetical protein